MDGLGVKDFSDVQFSVGYIIAFMINVLFMLQVTDPNIKFFIEIFSSAYVIKVSEPDDRPFFQVWFWTVSPMLISLYTKSEE